MLSAGRRRLAEEIFILPAHRAAALTEGGEDVEALPCEAALRGSTCEQLHERADQRSLKVEARPIEVLSDSTHPDGPRHELLQRALIPLPHTVFRHIHFPKRVFRSPLSEAVGR
jgi:hypothetical protein